MRFSEIENSIIQIWKNDPSLTVYVSGPPGIGKTSMAYDAAKKLGIKEDHVVIFRPSLRDPVDLMGVPSVSDGVTHWNPPNWLHQMQHGRWMFCGDEVAQGVVMMQNAMAGLFLDSMIGDIRLSPEVYKFCTGNRLVDKAGANRIVSQLANRVLHYEMEANLDDWVIWANKNGIQEDVVAFLKSRPNLLCSFKPDEFSNPTPRQWERVSRLPKTLSLSSYHASVSGLVGAGAATEYTQFQTVIRDMPDVEEIMKNPKRGKIPTDVQILFAVVTSLARRVNTENANNIFTYIDRLLPEFQMSCVVDMRDCCPEIGKLTVFKNWVVRNQHLL